MLAEANARTRARPNRLEDLAYRIYIRHAGDFDAVRQAFAAVAGRGAAAVFLQADVCRADLLVEIEAQAGRAPERS